MAARYVKVSREKMTQFLEACGFSKRVVGAELVYVRAHHICGDVWVKVWTSLPAADGDVRGKGRDAIRVTVAYESQDAEFRGRKNFGIHKTKRVFRTGTEQDVLDRLYERMREGYARANGWVEEHREGLSTRRPDGSYPPPPRPKPKLVRPPTAGMNLAEWKAAVERAAAKYSGRIDWARAGEAGRVAFNERRSPIDFAEQHAIGAKHPTGVWEDDA